jgi:ArsR family transcriptional regulator, virulence genes transcriptional regulator
MNLSKMRASAAAATGFLKSLANEHRLLVLCQLAQGEKSVGELQKRLGLRQAHLSQVLAHLRQSGLVRTRRESQTIYYQLDSGDAVATIELLYRLFCSSRSRAPAARARRRPYPSETGAVETGR